MPQIPRYNPIGAPQVATRPLPDIRIPTNVPAGAAGVGAGLDLSGVEHALEGEYLKQVDRFNQAAVTGARAKLAALETRIAYDPEAGFIRLKGKDALGAADVVNSMWDKGVSEIEAGLTNDTQKAAFASDVAQRRANLGETVARHTSQQLQEYDTSEFKSLLANTSDAAVAAAIPGASADDVSSAASLNIMHQRDAISQFAKRNGIGDEERDRMLNDTRSRTHLAVFSRMLENNESEGLRYYDEVKSEFTGEDAAKAEAMFKAASLRGESQRIVDKLLVDYDQDRHAAIAEVKKIKRPELRDAAQTRLEHEFNLQDALKRDQQEADYLDATKAIEPYIKNGRPFLAEDVVPKQIWDRLPLEARNALQRRAGDRENDYKKWHSFLELTPRELGSLNQQEFETKYWVSFDNATRTRAEAMWQAARDAQRTGKLDPKTSADETFKDIINIVMRRQGWIPRSGTKLTDSQYQMFAAFSTAVLQEKEQQEAAKGKPLTGTEVLKIADDMAMRRMYIRDEWWKKDPKRLPINISKDERGRAYIPWDEIPPDSRTAIETDLKNQGKRATRDKIERIWAAVHGLEDRKLRDEIFKEP